MNYCLLQFHFSFCREVLQTACKELIFTPISFMTVERYYKSSNSPNPSSSACAVDSITPSQLDKNGTEKSLCSIPYLWRVTHSFINLPFPLRQFPND